MKTKIFVRTKEGITFQVQSVSGSVKDGVTLAVGQTLEKFQQSIPFQEGDYLWVENEKDDDTNALPN